MRHVASQRSSLIRYCRPGRVRGLAHRAPPSPNTLTSRFSHSRIQDISQLRVRFGVKINRKWNLRQAQESLERSLQHFKDLTRTKTLPRFRPSFRSDDSRRMRSYIQFITTPTVDTPGTGLVLHFDDRRYFFGQMHEGLQRASLQHGSKLLKVREVFLTGRVESQTIGGLLGVILTLADAAKASLESQKENRILKRDQALRRAREEDERRPRTTKLGEQRKPRYSEEVPPIVDLVQEPLGIHGGPNIMHTIATARSFVFRQGMPMDVDEYAEGTERTGPELEWQPTWEDENIVVWAIPIMPADQENLTPKKREESNKGQGVSRKRSHKDYMKGQRQGESAIFPTDSDINREDQAQKLRDHVVHEMFRSSWRFDKLVETPLAKVNLPAKIFVRDPKTNSLLPYDGPLPGGTAPVPDVNVFVRKPWPGALVTHLPPTTPSSTALSYIVRNHAQRGKFNVRKAKDLRVPSGPMFRQLTKGASVILEDGRTVTPDQVLEPGKEGGGVAIIDLPFRSYILPLLRRPEWYQKEVMKGVKAFIWILGPGVAKDELLISFMKEFKDFQHIVSSREQCSNQLMMTSAASASIRHHLIDPDHYSLLQHDNTGVLDDGPRNENSNYVMAKAGLILQLEPFIMLQDEEVHQPVNLVEAAEEMSPEVYELAKQARTEIETDKAQVPPKDQNLPSPDAEVICLGTGSALPSQHRNVSGTLLRVPGHGSYLFDVGENTLGQLKRIYSPEELAEVLQDLKMIWISHLHADHHLGTASMIKAWYHEVHGGDSVKRPGPSLEDQASKTDQILREGRRLFVVSSSYMMRWLYEFSSVEDFGYNQLVTLEAKPIPADTTHLDETRLEWNGVDVGFNTTLDLSVKSAMQSATGLRDLTACFVSHCHGAMGVAITFANGFKFSYSGDCRPSRNLAAIGKGSTVLVHEATFDDELQGDAKAKKHSTISEAVGVGVEMGARRIILTHFSQRYSKIPTMSDVQGLTVKLESAEAEAEEEDGDEIGPIQEQYIPNEAGTSLARDFETQPITGQNIQESLNENVVKVKLDSASLSQEKDMKIAVAFDYMHVKVKDIASLEKFTPALRELYKADEVRPVQDRKQSPHADGSRSGALHSANSKKGMGEKKDKESKGGGKRQAAATADEGSELIALDSRIAGVKLGLEAKVSDSTVRYGRKSKSKQHEPEERKQDRECDRIGQEGSHTGRPVVQASQEICAS